jgi:tRNA A-37 threonylcarbamoyl transferase component Bud32
MTTAQPLHASSSIPLDLHDAARGGPRVVIDGRYEVVRPIATGGMGDVLEVRQMMTGRTYALKLLRRELRGRKDVVARLCREALALGGIDHPGVVQVVDSGACADHGPFLVVEKLEGRGLDGLLAARGSLGAAGAARILRSLAETLVDVHRRGYVHRDIKPANVFVASGRGGAEVVKLLDFGVVGRSTPGGAMRLTVAGDLLGTLGYMAPEQLMDATVADPRSDLYSLGVVVLECLGVGLDALNQVRRESRPAQAALGRTDVDPRLVALLDRLLSLDPSQRPSLAAEVVQQLGGLGAEPVRMLGGYAAPSEARDTPTHCEPAVRRRAADEDARRRKPRAPYITPVRVMLPDGHVDGRSEDISAGGMLVLLREDLPHDGPVIVRFALPTTGHVISVAATPKWTKRQPGRIAVGLEFDELDAHASASIDAYVRYLAAS